MPRRFERQQGPVLADVVAFHLAYGRVRAAGGTRDQLVVRSFELLPADGKHVLRAHPEHFFPGVTEQFARGLVDVHETHRRAVDQHDHVGGVVHGEAKAPQLFLRRAAFRDVAHHGDDDVAPLRLDGAAEGLDRKPRAVLATVPASHGGVALAAFDQAAVDPRELFAGDRDDVLRRHGEQLFPGIAEFPARGIVDVDDAHAHRIDEPYHVFGRVHRGPEAAQLLFALLSLQELPNLAADDADRLHQPVFGLADLATVESEHAYRLSFRDDRENECAVNTGVARQLQLCHAGIFEKIGNPQRLPRLPYPAHQSDAWGVGDVARAGDVAVDRLVRHAPRHAKAHDCGLFVRVEVSAALPALGFTYGADRRLDCSGRVAGIGK